MAKLEDFVTITITADTKEVSRKNFDTILLIPDAEITPFTPATKLYSSITEIAVDFASTTREFKWANSVFSQDPRPQEIKIANRDAAETVTIVFNRVEDEDPDWGILNEGGHIQADIESLAGLIAPKDKIFVASSSDAAIKDSGSSTDVAATLQTATRQNTGLIFHQDPNEQFPEGAWAGKIVALGDPGTATWAFKTLEGIAPTPLTGAERSAILDKNASVYETTAGINHTFEGKVSSGTFFDVRRGIFFIRARLAEDIFQAFANTAKIVFTQGGISIIEGIIRARLQLFVDSGLLAADPAPVVTVPAIKDVPKADKLSRTLNNVEFSATLAGAIHKVDIKGFVSV